MSYRGGPGSETFLKNVTAAATVSVVRAAQSNKQHFLYGLLAKCDTAAQAITVTIGSTALPTIRIGNEDVLINFGNGIPSEVGGSITVAVATGTSVDVVFWGETLPGNAALSTS